GLTPVPVRPEESDSGPRREAPPSARAAPPPPERGPQGDRRPPGRNAPSRCPSSWRRPSPSTCAGDSEDRTRRVVDEAWSTGDSGVLRVAEASRSADYMRTEEAP